MQNFAEQLKLVKSSKQVHSTWYRETYPDVAALGLDPATHYLRYGAAMGRNPGKNFDTRFYLDTYPDAAASGLNPLVHYMLHGKAMGHATRERQTAQDQKQVSNLRHKLLSLGFTEQPLAELSAIMSDSRDPLARFGAAREIALWYLREGTEESRLKALDHLRAARKDAQTLAMRGRLLVAELFALYHLDRRSEALEVWEQAALRGESCPDALLAMVNFQPDAEARIRWINRALDHYGIPRVTLLPAAEGVEDYDRLAPLEAPPRIEDGPLVTVLIAAYEAGDMLPTALRSLQEQSWQNLEIIVLDDCSPSPGTVEVARRFAETDPRIRVIRMEENGGAYVARNRGLDEANGKYVTLNDADDWSHPLKIETQVRFLEEHPEVMGCTTDQARLTNDLLFTRFPHNASIIRVNVSSFMYRRRILDDLGGWATTRFGADSEFIARIKRVYGEQAVHGLQTGPFSFQRVSESSIVKNDYFGIDGFYFGVRHEFFSASNQYVARSRNVRLARERNNIPYPIPNPMKPDREDMGSPRAYDVVIASDYRMPGGSILSCLEEIQAQARAGLRTAVLTMYRYDLNYGDIRKMTPEVREVIQDLGIDVVSYGEMVACDTLILRYPPILQHPQRYLPQIDARSIRVIVNQPPMSDYGPDGIVRYDIATCARNVRQQFGKDAIWHPIGPVVRDALHRHHAPELHHIELSDQDWLNIIDIAGWDRGPRQRGPGDRLRIGRHSRDHVHKWPATREDILAAYPAGDDIEVHVLGGAGAPAGLIGEVPSNWVVHPFGSLHPREFLAGVDVYIYFSHPDWVESFGRVIIEAMAVGVPVILPEVYRPLFQDAALYATPQTAVELARRLHADPVAYAAQVHKAQVHAMKNFSHEMHIGRLKAAGVNV